MWQLGSVVDLPEQERDAVIRVRAMYKPEWNQPIGVSMLNESGKLMYEQALRLRTTGPEDAINAACVWELEHLERAT